MKKLNKEQLVEVLRANSKLKAVKSDEAMASILEYTLDAYKENAKSVTKKDLLDVAQDLSSLLGDKFKMPVFAEEKETPEQTEDVKELKKKATPSKKGEASLKKPSKKADEKTKEPEEEEPAPKSKKGSPKKSSKKDEPKKKESTKVNDVFDEGLSEVFLDTLTVGEDVYRKDSDITDLGEIYDALEKEEDIIFACMWTKKQLKLYPYACPDKPPVSFPNDLDVVTPVYVSERDDNGKCKICYGISVYTEGFYAFLAEDMDTVEDGVRFSGGIAYAIYRLAEDSEAEETK